MLPPNLKLVVFTRPHELSRQEL